MPFLSSVLLLILINSYSDGQAELAPHIVRKHVPVLALHEDTAEGCQSVYDNNSINVQYSRCYI